METIDWKTQSSLDDRREIVNKIVDNLKIHVSFSGQEKLHEIVSRFEEKIYAAATSQADYRDKISIKLLALEKKYANPITNSLQSTSAGSQGMQHDINKGQPPPVLVPSSHPQAGKQILPPNIHTNIASSPLPSGSGMSQSNMPNIASQNPSLQNIENISGAQQISVGNSMGQGIIIPPANFVSQREIPESQQQSQNSQHYQHQQQIETQQLQQHTSTVSVQSHILQQKLQASNFQPSQQPVMQSTMSQPSSLATIHHNQQPIFPQSASAGSTSQTGNPNSGDWKEEVYQKMRAMKDKYMLYMRNMHQKVIGILHQHDSLPQQPKVVQFERLKQLLEGCMAFLQIPKTKLTPNHKEKLGIIERQIISILNLHKRKPEVTLEQPLTAPHIISQHQSHQTQAHLTQLQPHENEMNSESINLQSSKMAGLHHNNMDLLKPNFDMLQHREVQQQFLHNQQLLYQQPRFPPQIKQQQQNGNQTNINNKTGVPFSSAQIDQQKVRSSVTKFGIPMQSASSPFIVSSPPTQSTSHMPKDSEKVIAVSSLFNAGNIGHQPAALMLPSESQPLTVGTPGISPPSLLSQFTSPDENHGNGASIVSGKCMKEEPIEHLLKVVKSISPKSLSAAVSDIGSVISMIDSIAGSEPGDRSLAAVGEDLAAMTKSRLQQTFISQDRTAETRKAKRLSVVSSTISVNDSFKHKDYMNASEFGSTIKRPRIEKRHPLLDEIREINQGLIDTVVDIDQDDADPAAASEVGKGIVVKCSFSTVAFGPSLKLQYASSLSPIQPLRLLVPANYPDCSPILLDEFPLEASKEYEDLSIKAKCRFSSRLRKLSDPMSLREIARTWDVCARAVILEYAQQSCGGTFTSKYGALEDCFAAA